MRGDRKWLGSLGTGPQSEMSEGAGPSLLFPCTESFHWPPRELRFPGRDGLQTPEARTRLAEPDAHPRLIKIHSLSFEVGFFLNALLLPGEELCPLPSWGFSNPLLLPGQELHCVSFSYVLGLRAPSLLSP